MNSYLQIHLSYKFELGKDCGERLVCSSRPPRSFKIKRSASLLREVDILLRLDHSQFWTENSVFFFTNLSCVADCTRIKKSFYYQLLKFPPCTHLLRIKVGHLFIVMLNLISVDDSSGIITDPPWETESRCLWGGPWGGHEGHLWGCWDPNSWSVCSKMAKS